MAVVAHLCRRSLIRRPRLPADVEATRNRIVAGLAVIYGVWGSTYLAILLAVDSIPPLLMAGSRFLLAGALLWAFTGAPKRLRPSRRDIAWAFALGAGFFLMGNGFLSVAETRIASGLAALAIASVPVWIALLEAIRPATRPPPLARLGLGVGAAGVVVLVGAGDGAPFSLRGQAGWVVLLLVGSLGWAVASLAGRGAMRLPMLPSVALQMAAGGLLLLAAGVARGELAEFAWSRVTASSAGGWAYLVLAGSVLAFSTYAWLLQVAPPSLVSTYAFVNPLIAVVLGALFAQERLGWRTLLAGALILAAVAMTVWAKARARRVPPLASPRNA